MSLNIKGPDGRIVACPRSLIVTTIDSAGTPVDSISVAALKPGWSVATAADVAALVKAQADAVAPVNASPKPSKAAAPAKET